MENDFNTISRRNYSQLREGTGFQQPQPDIGPYTAKFYGLKKQEGLKFDELARFINKAGQDCTLIFKYTDFTAPATYDLKPGDPMVGMVVEEINHTTQFIYTNDQNQKIETRLAGKLNERTDIIDVSGWAQVIIVNPKDKIIRGDLKFYYDNTSQFRTYFKPDRFNIDEIYLAIQLSSVNLTDYAYLVRNLIDIEGFNFIKNEIALEFSRQINSSQDDAELNFLYENIPDLIIADLKNYISPDQALEDLALLKQRDDTGALSFVRDSSKAIINLLKVAGDASKIYNKFKSDPVLVKEIYYNFDGTVDTVAGPEKARAVFANLIYALAINNGYDGFIKEEKEGEPEQTFATFHVGGNYKLDSNVMPGNDTQPGKIFLKQLKGTTVHGSSTSGDGMLQVGMQSYDTVSTVFKDVDEGLYFHPMVPVYLIIENGEKGESYFVPAIFVKSISDEAEWKDINRNIRIGLDLLAVIIGVASLGTASPLLLALSAVDIGIATVDAIVAIEEDELMKTPQGQAFLSAWNKVVLVGGVLTAGPLLINGALKTGSKLLNAITDLTRIETILFLKNIVQQLTLARLANASAKLVIRVIETAEEFWKIIRREIYLAKIQNLKKAGCIFTAIEDSSGKIIGYAVSYKGEIIAQGSAKQLDFTLESLYKLRNEDLIVRLDDLSDVSGILEVPRFLKAVAEVRKNRFLVEFLTIEEEAIIKYYSSFTYEALNKALRGLEKLTDELRAYKTLLNRALAKLPNSIYNGKKYTLYRSVEFSEELIAKIKKEGKFTEEGFLSTSYDWEVFKENWLSKFPKHNVLFKVEGKNGKLIEVVSTEDEAEIVFASRTKFNAKVNEIRHPLFPDDPDRMITEIILKEL